MLQLSQINIYPVKSLDGYSPQSAVVEKRGLQHDRRWMIVDEHGIFMTQRNKRKMPLLAARVVGETLIIEEKNNLTNHIQVNIHQMSDEINVEVWDDKVLARKVNEKVDTFLSDFLDTPCHLVKMPETSYRRVEEDRNTGNDIVSFADGYPFLIIGENSINDLNSRLDVPLNPENEPLIGMRRFRTNFVFSGGEPYEEESWSRFKIGKVDFEGIKPCGRCMMTTLNPDTGERQKEPLELLSQYRKVEKKSFLGKMSFGKVKIGRMKIHPKCKSAMLFFYKQIFKL